MKIHRSWQGIRLRRTQASADPDEPDSIAMDRLLLQEVCERTPSYHSWQQEQWLVHCDQPCAFVGYTDHTEIKQLEQENRELKRANAILKSASAFFAAELDRPQR